MSSTRHAMLNSLLSQIYDDASTIMKNAGSKNYLGDDEAERIGMAAQAIQNKIATYQKLNAPSDDIGGQEP